MELGVQLTLDTCIEAVTVIVVFRAVPDADAVTVTAVLFATVPALAIKVAVLEPAATVTDAGTVKALLLSEIATLTPPLGALLLNVTVQVLIPPANTLGEAQLSPVNVMGATNAREKTCELPFRLAVICAVWSALMLPAVAVKFAVVAPAGTVTIPGTINAVLLAVRLTFVPALGAAVLTVTVQLAVPGALTAPGVQLNPLT